MSNSIISQLRMIELYHEKFEFYQTRKEQKLKLNPTFNIKYFKKSDEQNKIKVQLNTCIKDDEDNYKLTLSTIGIFELDKGDLSDDIANNVLKMNTLSIIFPYVRTQISLLTTQPGVQPILLPLIDVKKFIETATKQDD